MKRTGRKKKGNPLPFDYAATTPLLHLPELGEGNKGGKRHCHAIQFSEKGCPDDIYIELVLAETQEEARHITLDMFPGAFILSVKTIKKNRPQGKPGARFINGQFIPTHSH